MDTRTLSRWFFMIALMLTVIIVFGVVLTSPASAQCGTANSSCITCHGLGSHVTGMGEWNSVHVNQDMCINCHGGNGSTMDKDLAHASLVAQPLSDIYTNCHSCHPEDYTMKAAQIASAVNVTPNSCATPTSIAMISNPGEMPSASDLVPAGQRNLKGDRAPFLLISGIVAALIFFLFGLIWLNRHHT